MISISVEKETNFAMYSSLRVDREPFKLSPFELFNRAILAPESDRPVVFALPSPVDLRCRGVRDPCSWQS